MPADKLPTCPTFTHITQNTAPIFPDLVYRLLDHYADNSLTDN